MLGGPPAPVAAPVPLPSDGRAVLFDLAESAAIVPTDLTLSFSANIMNFVHRPDCYDAPFDILLVQGPVMFNKRVKILLPNVYEYTQSVTSDLEVMPVPPGPWLPEIVDWAPPRLVTGTENGWCTATGSFTSSVAAHFPIRQGRPQGFITTMILRVGRNDVCTTVQNCLPPVD
jgi:hypothetical protein